ncbi:hypothetical protein ACJJTC_014247 [Scirpophaga incertulas]
MFDDGDDFITCSSDGFVSAEDSDSSGTDGPYGLCDQLRSQFGEIRSVRIRHLPAPWITAAIKKVMSKRDKAKQKLRLHPNDCSLEIYKKLRNRCNRLCRDAKRSYFHSKISNLDQNRS